MFSTLVFLMMKYMLRIEDMVKLPPIPIITDVIPQYLGRNHIQTNINMELIK